MSDTTISLQVQNVSCEACSKVIARLLKSFPGAVFRSISDDASTLTLSCRSEDESSIRARLAEYGYLRSSHSPPASMDFLMRVLRGEKGFRSEHLILRRVAGMFVLLLGAVFLLNQFIFPSLPNGTSISVLAWFLPFGISVNAIGLIHTRLVRAHCSCTTAMMIGMTIGMISGFLLGALVGASNGMFVGTVSGMLVGMVVGGYSARFAGPMGSMEGMMAGLMSGTMGAMLSVMMIYDNLLPFLVLLFASCALILLGLSYLVFREAGPIMEEKSLPSFWSLAVLSVVVLLGILAVMIYAPHSVSVWTA